MRLVRTPLARDDLIAIWRYIATDNQDAADALIDRIDRKLRGLIDNPLLGRARAELATGVRSVVVGNYVLFYRALPDEIVLVRVLHGAREIRGLPLD